MEKPKIKYPIVCEGKYDKIKLCSIVEGHIITTDGFGIFNNREKELLIKRLCGDGKLIVLTDSDSAGMLIRNRLRDFIPKDRLINLYTPCICGKEKRKTSPSAQGLLGVEGMERELLYEMLLPYSCDEIKSPGGLSKADMYALGLSGHDGAKALRERVCRHLSLPPLSANALLEALNMLYSKEETIEAVDAVKTNTENENDEYNE